MSYVIDRRSLLGLMGAATVSGCATGAPTSPFFKRHSLPVGLQLYTLAPDAQKDLEGTLKAVAAIGYRDIELAGFYGRTPQQMKAALDGAGLKSTSAHIQGRGTGPDPNFSGDMGQLASVLELMGAKTAILPSPYIPDRLDQKPKEGEASGVFFRRVLGEMKADDWKVNADFLNDKARKLKASGIRVGYHNHNNEFLPLGDTYGLEILLKNTDPSVTFEMDVGWVAAAGRDPQELLNKHKGRFTMMHVKDLKASTKPNYTLTMDPTEVGSGTVNWKALLPAAYAAGVRGFFVEQEAPFEHPRIESVKIDHDYLAALVA